MLIVQKYAAKGVQVLLLNLPAHVLNGPLLFPG